ncbi:MAG: SDR family NAD(P)-dependent oxidoreductase [Bradymonadia bacterium]
MTSLPRLRSRRAPLPDRPRVVITGAGSGLGRALAEAFATRGAWIGLTDIKNDGLMEVAALVKRKGGLPWTRICDVADADQMLALADDAFERMSGVDVLINNAGVAVGGPIGQATLQDWRWVMDINLWGVIHGCHAFVPRMLEQPHSWVLNVSSAAGLLAPAKMAPYNVTKAGVVSLTETLAAEAWRDGLTATVLCPTFFETNLLDSARGNTEKTRNTIARMMKHAKVQAPDVAEAAIEAMSRGQLYALPMQDGRRAWRLKRMIPERYQEVLDQLMGRR